MPQALNYTKNIRCKNMDLNDLIKLAGIQNAQAPVQEEPVVSSSDGMRTMIALVTPEQLNQLTGDAPVAEEMPGEATTEPNPQEYEGTLGSPADLSLRRYLGANGEHVTVDETNVYEDHKVEDITEAWNAYKTDPIAEAHACGCDDSCACGGNCGPNCNCHSGCSATNESITEAPYQYDMSDKGDMHDALGDVQNSMDDAVKNIQKAAGLARQVSDEIENSLYTDESVTEDAGKVGYMEMFFTDRDGGEVSQEVEVTLKDGRLDVTGPLPGPEDDLYWDDADIEEQLRDAMQDMSVITWMNEDTIDEADIDENAFNQAAAAAARANKSEFEFGGKKYKTKMSKDTAHKLDDDIDVLKQLAGL